MRVPLKALLFVRPRCSGCDEAFAALFARAASTEAPLTARTVVPIAPAVSSSEWRHVFQHDGCCLNRGQRDEACPMRSTSGRVGTLVLWFANVGTSGNQSTFLRS